MDLIPGSSEKTIQVRRCFYSRKILNHLKTDWFRYGFETLAVIVGILVAFALDSWGENHKSQKEFAGVLEEIHDDLVLDTASISRILNLRILDFEAQTRVAQAILEDLPFDDQIQSDLGKVMLKRSIPLTSSGFNLLRETKLTSMQDKVLRSYVIEYYEVVAPKIKEEYLDDEFEFETVWLPYVRQHATEWDFGEYAIPEDWEALKKDHYFLSSIQINPTNINSTLEALQKGLDMATKLLVFLDEE